MLDARFDPKSRPRPPPATLAARLSPEGVVTNQTTIIRPRGCHVYQTVHTPWVHEYELTVQTIQMIVRNNHSSRIHRSSSHCHRHQFRRRPPKCRCENPLLNRNTVFQRFYFARKRHRAQERWITSDGDRITYSAVLNETNNASYFSSPRKLYQNLAPSRQEAKINL